MLFIVDFSSCYFTLRCSRIWKVLFYAMMLYIMPIKSYSNLVWWKYWFWACFETSVLESGYYWRREALDPEPGRCRRTDGKKWRCSKDAVAGQKYCDRHMHRGRNRSRKPVEQREGSLSAIDSVSSSHSASFNLLHLGQR